MVVGDPLSVGCFRFSDADAIAGVLTADVGVAAEFGAQVSSCDASEGS